LNDVKSALFVFQDIVQIVTVEMHIERQGFPRLVSGFFSFLNFEERNLI